MHTKFDRCTVIEFLYTTVVAQEFKLYIMVQTFEPKYDHFSTYPL